MNVGAWPPPRSEVMAPEALFRLLTMAPRPEMAIDKAKAGLADIAGSFSVVGLTTHEWEAIGGKSDRLIAASLRMNGEPAFYCEEDVGALPVSVTDSLLSAVIDAVQIVSPMRATAHFAEWRTVLCLGARHPSNYTILNALGRSYDLFIGNTMARSCDRPDRYFGVPLHALTDGQWMAAEAARAVIEENYRK